MELHNSRVEISPHDPAGKETTPVMTSALFGKEKWIFAAFISAVVAATFLATVVFLYTPIGTDGGWFSYPALAISRYGDAGENRLSLEEAENIKGIKAIFSFDTRLSIRVIPMSLWFKAFGTSIWAVKLFGVLELLSLMILSFMVIQKNLREEELDYYSGPFI